MPHPARKLSSLSATPRAIGYVRVSTDKQADHGVSLDAQVERIRAMATVQGVDLVDVIVDAGESAATLQRPGLARLLALVEARHVQVVIIQKLDRLTRSVRDLADLLDRFERRGVALVSLGENLDTGTASGRLVLNVMMSVAQWEREAVGERTSAALQHKKSQGLRVGNIAFGYRLAADGKTLEPEETEQRALAVVRELREAGLALRTIAAELNRLGISTRSGSPWRHQYVAPLLQACLMGRQVTSNNVIQRST